MEPRPAKHADLPALAQLWHDAWHEAHTAHLPEDFTSQRTVHSFQTRLSDAGDALRMIGTATTALGLCIINEDEIDAIFVAPDARGTGVAAILLADGEARLKASGIQNAHLICLIQNLRAARFYEKSGWLQIGTIKDPLQTPSGVVEVECRVFRKPL